MVYDIDKLEGALKNSNNNSSYQQDSDDNLTSFLKDYIRTI